MDQATQGITQRPDRVAPLFGRAREQQLLLGYLDAALEGTGHLVLIGGEAGIGKTALVRDLQREAVARGLVTLTGHCFDLSSTPPYGPWLDLAARYTLGGELPPPPASLSGDGLEEIRSQAALFADVRAFLAAVTAKCPVLLVLEDLHWADPGSLELLRYLAAQIQTMPLLMLVTYRLDEPARSHPFYLQLPALIRDAEGRRIDLRRLEADALHELVASGWRLAAHAENQLVDYLECHSDGNPLYAKELLRTLEEEGLLRPAAVGWELDEIDRVVLPPYVRQVIDARVARLGEEMRQPLAMAAVIGHEVPLDLWANVMGLGVEELVTIVERAVEAYLLDAEIVGTRIRFYHSLTRQALYEGVLAPRRRIWHRQVGAALSASPSPEPDAVAYHFQQAGDPRAWEWLVRAGEHAQRAYAWLTATERFAAAADQLEGVAGRERTRGWLLYRCGKLQRFSQPALGIDDLAEAERLARMVHDLMLAADARYSRGVLRFYADDFRLALEDMATGATALEALPADEAFPSDTASAWLADSLPAKEIAGSAEFDSGAIQLSRLGVSHRRGGLPWFLAAAGHLTEAQSMAESFLSKARSVTRAGELVLSATGHAYQGLAIAHSMLGRPDQARCAYAQAREVYGALDHHAVIAFTLLSELEEIILPFAVLRHRRGCAKTASRRGRRRAATSGRRFASRRFATPRLARRALPGGPMGGIGRHRRGHLDPRQLLPASPGEWRPRATGAIPG